MHETRVLQMWWQHRMLESVALHPQSMQGSQTACHNLAEETSLLRCSAGEPHLDAPDPAADVHCQADT